MDNVNGVTFVKTEASKVIGCQAHQGNKLAYFWVANNQPDDELDHYRISTPANKKNRAWEIFVPATPRDYIIIHAHYLS